MKKGWYILNYHDISWEENIYVRGIGGSFPVDIFRLHLEELNLNGRLVSISDGLMQYSSGNIREPLISLWFDDGLIGVRKYALPLLEKYEIKSATSLNSKFFLREEMNWRFKLSFISQTGGLMFLKSELQKYGCNTDLMVSKFVLDNFSEEIVQVIDSVYHKYTRECDREDAFRLFDNVNGLKELHRNGWEICNHSASHYPISEDTYIHKFREEFEECERKIDEYLGIKTRYWVIPFDRGSHRSKNLTEVFNSVDAENRYLVLVGNKFNRNYTSQKNILYRIFVPYVDGKGLVKYLSKIPSDSA